jgi:hypothetical protein
MVPWLTHCSAFRSSSGFVWRFPGYFLGTLLFFCIFFGSLLGSRSRWYSEWTTINATSTPGDGKQTSIPGDSGCTENPPKHQSIFKLILSSNGKTPDPKQKKRKRTATENQSHNKCITGRDILKFLESFTYTLTSESGAEYSNYTARGNIKQDCGYNFLGDFKILFSKEKVQQVFNLEMISPASAIQIQREMPFSSWTDIVETPQLYHGVTQPHIASVIEGGALKLIQNVIHLKKEKERILQNTDEHGGWFRGGFSTLIKNGSATQTHLRFRVQSGSAMDVQVIYTVLYCFSCLITVVPEMGLSTMFWRMESVS